LQQADHFHLLLASQLWQQGLVRAAVRARGQRTAGLVGSVVPRLRDLVRLALGGRPYVWLLAWLIAQPWQLGLSDKGSVCHLEISVYTYCLVPLLLLGTG